MKKILTGTALGAMMPLFALAQGQAPGQLQIVVDRLTNYAIGIIIAVSVLYILYAGWVFLSSQGDPVATGRARSIIIYAFVGIGVALAARILVSIAQQIFTF